MTDAKPIRTPAEAIEAAIQTVQNMAPIAWAEDSPHPPDACVDQVRALVLIHNLRTRLAPPAPAAPPFPPPRYDEVYAEGTRRLFEENEPQPVAPPPPSDAQAGELAKRMRFAVSPGGLDIHGEVARLFEAALLYVESAARASREPEEHEDPESPVAGSEHEGGRLDVRNQGAPHPDRDARDPATSPPPPAPSRAPQGDEALLRERIERAQQRIDSYLWASKLARGAEDEASEAEAMLHEILHELLPAMLDWLATPPSAGGEDGVSLIARSRDCGSDDDVCLYTDEARLCDACQQGAELAEAREEIAELRLATPAAGAEDVASLCAALTTIANGMTHEFPGAPDVMDYGVERKHEFRGAMWGWSQQVAKAALAARQPQARKET